MRRTLPACIAVLLSGCGARSGLDVEDVRRPDASVQGPTAIPPVKNQARADKIDLLFVVDDSGSMADKQTILSRAVPDLVARLVNPLCVDRDTLAPVSGQPKTALDACPGTSLREFNAVQDLHIGVVSTSLGGVGASNCGVGFGAVSANDHAHLTPPSGAPRDQPFLVRDPARVAASPGGGSAVALETSVRNLISLGEGGCAYEMPLEAMYRFLVDPDPYERVEVSDCGAGRCAAQVGTDDVLLAQRRAFLRPDSLVAVVVLSDENDCSLTAGGQSYRVFDQPGTVPRATSTCARDANDPCCASCEAVPGAGCPATDAECAKGPYPASEDSGLLRCFDQKRRLGVDYLYPVSRYVNGLTGKQVPRRDGTLVDNPLFVDPKSGVARDPSLVFFASIVGVPWQDLAVDPGDGTTLQFKSPLQMETDGTWDVVLGDPEHAVLPRDPLMVESTDQRSGTQPVTHEPLAPSTSAPTANSINGHETNLGEAPMDLQYTCVFDLPSPQTSIDCTSFTGTERAICQAPDGTYGSTQYRAKAYPGLRELAVSRGLGPNGIAASICARNVKDESREDYGYRSALRQILDRLRFGLN